MPRKTGCFRICRKEFGLTWSCPIDADVNPIPDKQTIIDMLEELYGESDYIVAHEMHKLKNEDGELTGEIHPTKNHFHAYFKFKSVVDSTNVKLFDLYGVHPNICDPPLGKRWNPYITKDGDYLSNFWSADPWSVALSLPTAQDAIEHLWTALPKEMCKFGHNITTNINKRMRSVFPPTTYDGPYPKQHFDAIKEWRYKTHSLLIWGPPGEGKTQFAKYILTYLFGDFHYVKGRLDDLRKADFSLPILFDEINMLDADPEQSKEITDVENGGTIGMRYADVSIPPGVPRIFLHNIEHPFRNPSEAVYGRRVITSYIGPEIPPRKPPGPVIRRL